MKIHISEHPKPYTLSTFLEETGGYRASDFEYCFPKAQANGHAFAFIYMATVKSEIDTLRRGWCNGVCPEFTVNYLLEVLMYFDQVIRQAVDQALFDYLKEYGIIDSWPLPPTDMGLELRDKYGSRFKYKFEYFGMDYQVISVENNEKKTITKIGRKPQSFYRNGCPLDDTEEYKNM
ncbi:MAG: hypothetical protein ACI4UK_01020, partial [Floccifex sp.]